MILTPHYPETVENDIPDMSDLSCLLARSTQNRFGTLVVSDGMPMQEVVELRKEIDDVKLDVNLEKSEESYGLNEWDQFIDSAKFISKNQSRPVDWTGINTPPKSPDYLDTIIKIFPNQDGLVSSSRKLQEHVMCSILGKDILDRSLNLGSSAFEIESSVDKKVKSNMRPEGQQSRQQMDV